MDINKNTFIAKSYMKSDISLSDIAQAEGQIFTMLSYVNK